MVFLICTCYTVFSVAVQYITVTSITSTDCLRCCICRSRSRCLCCAVSGGLSEYCAVKWSNHYLPLRVRRASLTAEECCSTHYQLQLNNNNKLFLLYSFSLCFCELKILFMTMFDRIIIILTDLIMYRW